MGARRGGGERGHLPPLEIQKYWGPPKDNLTRKKLLKKLRGPHIVSEETDLEDPHLVSEETDLRGPPYSMRRNRSEGAPI